MNCVGVDRTTTDGKVIGTVSALVGVAAVATAIIFATGMYGHGSMYLLAGGLAVASLIPFCISAFVMCREPEDSEEPDQSPVF